MTGTCINYVIWWKMPSSTSTMAWGADQIRQKVRFFPGNLPVQGNGTLD